MKLFLDSANIEEIKNVKELNILSGVTTNPTLLAKQLVNIKSDPFKESKKVLEEICKITDVPILAEPVSTEYKKIVDESLELLKISPKQIVAKIPITSEGLKAVKELKQKGFKTAFTLIFSLSQALIASMAEVDYICPFVGRLDDIGQVGTDLIKEIMQVYKLHNVKTKVIVASVRNVEHIKKSAEYGADFVTIPHRLILEMLSCDLTTKGIQKFIDDWNKVSKQI
ncbi:MAG: transaldolase family protein [Endomicrobiia bacterium]